MHFASQPKLFVVVVGDVEFGEARFALAVLDEDEADHCGFSLPPSIVVATALALMRRWVVGGRGCKRIMFSEAAYVLADREGI